MPNTQPGYVSFQQYMDANQGSIPGMAQGYSQQASTDAAQAKSDADTAKSGYAQAWNAYHAPFSWGQDPTTGASPNGLSDQAVWGTPYNTTPQQAQQEYGAREAKKPGSFSDWAGYGNALSEGQNAQSELAGLTDQGNQLAYGLDKGDTLGGATLDGAFLGSQTPGFEALQNQYGNFTDYLNDTSKIDQSSNAPLPSTQTNVSSPMADWNRSQGQGGNMGPAPAGSGKQVRRWKSWAGVGGAEP